MKKTNQKIIKSEFQTGFAMLFAVLTASLLLTIGISIFNITFKELLISTAARESQMAFYAADSARECALYWDMKEGAFPACQNSTCTSKTGGTFSSDTIKCNGLVTNLTQDETLEGSGIISYQNSSVGPFIKYGGELDPEADIIIIKEFIAGENRIKTTISASGHNVSPSGKRLERGIVQTY